MNAAAKAPYDITAVYSSWQRTYVDEGNIAPFGPVVEPDVVGKPSVIFMLNSYCAFPNTICLINISLETIRERKT